MVRRNAGAMTILAFTAVVVAIGVFAGSAWMGAGLGALLLVGSTLVAAEGEPLAARAATVMGLLHVVAVTLTSL